MTRRVCAYPATPCFVNQRRRLFSSSKRSLLTRRFHSSTSSPVRSLRSRADISLIPFQSRVSLMSLSTHTNLHNDRDIARSAGRRLKPRLHADFRSRGFSRCTRRSLGDVEDQRAGLVAPVDGRLPEGGQDVEGIQGGEPVLEVPGPAGLLVEPLGRDPLFATELLPGVGDGLGLDDIEVACGGIVLLQGKDEEVTFAPENVVGLAGALGLTLEAEIRDGFLRLHGDLRD